MKTYPVILLTSLCVFFNPGISFSQVPVTNFTTSNTVVVAGGTLTQTVKSHASAVNTVLPSTNYNVKYNNNGNISITSFSHGGKSYVKFSGFDTIIVKRVANAWETTAGNKQHIYVQGNVLVDNLTFNMPFPAAYPQTTNTNFMERVMEDGYINRGSDNVFNNDANSDLTFNNIERVDFVYKPGISTLDLTTAGFLIAERGGNDDFKICAITGVNASGEPTAFGPVVSVKANAYGNSIASMTTYVMRKDATDNTLRPFSLVTLQSVKALFVRLSDLGISSWQKVYGYTLMGDDVTATTSAQVLDYTNNTYFPRNTTTSDGGMDIAAAPGIFHTDLILSTQDLAFTAQSKNCQQQLQWSDVNYATTRQYEVQRSDDGEHFTTINTVTTISSKKNALTDNYTRSAYYRIKAISTSGQSHYSPIVFVTNDCVASVVSIRPNPASDMIQVNYSASMKVRKVAILSLSGKEINSWSVAENSTETKVDISTLPAGQYYVRVTNDTGTQKAYPFIKL